MADYYEVIHALQLKGIDGHYGNQRKTVFSVLVQSVMVRYTLLRRMDLDASPPASRS